MPILQGGSRSTNNANRDSKSAPGGIGISNNNNKNG